MPTKKRAPQKPKAMREKLEKLKDLVSGLDGVRRPMAEDLLTTYVDLYQDYLELERVIREKGLLVEEQRGGANNQHMVLAKNPAFDMRKTCVSQMADLANKISRFVTVANADPEDEFDAF